MINRCIYSWILINICILGTWQLHWNLLPSLNSTFVKMIHLNLATRQGTNGLFGMGTSDRLNGIDDKSKLYLAYWKWCFGLVIWSRTLPQTMVISSCVHYYSSDIVLQTVKWLLVKFYRSSLSLRNRPQISFKVWLKVVNLNLNGLTFFSRFNLIFCRIWLRFRTKKMALQNISTSESIIWYNFHSTQTHV